MAKTNTRELRIYCLCGQKMKVTSSMFGRPGKCIACRQKMRVPELHELPADTTVIYLKDYPQFLRKPATPATHDSPLEDEHEESLGDGEDQETTTPIDVLESLRILCSYEAKVQRQLDFLRGSKPGSAAAKEKAALLGYRALVRKARNELDEQLRARASETTEQLASAKEQIARASLSLRIGEMDYEQFQHAVLPLRHRRDRLERRIQNVRGWLRVTDPYLAGGYIDVPLEEAPVEQVAVQFPPPRQEDDAIVNRRIDDLRLALQARELAERKLVECKRMEKEGSLAQNELHDCLADAEATLERARQEMAFARGRLDQVVADSESDTRAIKAHLELARHRLEAGEIDRHAYHRIENDLLRGQSDNAKARDLARRGLNANSIADVPHAEGTFLRRLSAPPPIERGLGLDTFIAWGAAVLMLISIAVPVADTSAMGNPTPYDTPTAIFLFVAAALTALCAVFPRRNMRGIAINVLWVVITLGVAFLLQRSRYSLGPMGTALRQDSLWYLNAGVLLQVIAMLVLGLAAMVSLAPSRRLRIFPGLAALTIVLGTFAILSDGMGIFAPKAALAEPEPVAQPQSLGYQVTVPIANVGWRDIWLAEERSRTPAPYRYILERRIGSNSWEDHSDPVSLQRAGESWTPWQQQGSLTGIQIAAGQNLLLRHQLPAGEYRAHLIDVADSSVVSTRSFELEELAPPAPELQEPVPAPDVPATTNEVPLPLPEETQPAVDLVELELQGLINAAGKEPRFALQLHRPGQPSESLFLRIGDTIVGSWTVKEFSPVNQSVTLSNGDGLFIIKAGERLELSR